MFNTNTINNPLFFNDLDVFFEDFAVVLTTKNNDEIKILLDEVKEDLINVKGNSSLTKLTNKYTCLLKNEDFVKYKLSEKDFYFINKNKCKLYNFLQKNDGLVECEVVWQN